MVAVIIPLSVPLTGIPYDNLQYFSAQQFLNDLAATGGGGAGLSPLAQTKLRAPDLRARWKSIISICFRSAVW